MSSTRLKNCWRRHGTGLSLVILTWLLFFSRLLSGRYFYFLDDLKIIYYPLETLYTAAQARFTLPVWSNLFGFGQPIIAWGQLGFLAPIHLLLRAIHLPPLTLLQVSVVVYFLVGAIGMFAFLRYRRLSAAAAAIGAIVFTFSGFMVGHLNHVNFYTATTLLPLLLLAIELLLTKPTLPCTAILALVAAAAALGGQPQITLYTLLIGTIYGLVRWSTLWPRQKLKLFRPTGLVLLAALLFLGLSSLAILPLREFQPLTERGEDLSATELVEFSYPPSHAITLIFPTFFGDKVSYWGAKNFQELAAYTGLLPLLLAGLAGFTWRGRHVSLRLFGLMLVIVGLVFALGKYSVVYRFLIETRLLTTLTTPGRFTLFFDVGISILAAVGLQDLQHFTTLPRWQRLLAASLSTIIVATLFAPFFIVLPVEPRYLAPLSLRLTTAHPEWLLTVLAIVVWLVALALQRFPRLRPSTAYVFILVTAGTLLAYGWNYNPVIPRQLALARPSWQSQLSTAPVPARLYGRDQIFTENLIKYVRSSEPITHNFTIIQPFIPEASGNRCLRLLLYANELESHDSITVSLKTSLTDPPIAQTFVRPADISQHGYTVACFDQDLVTQRLYFIMLSAPRSRINAYLVPATGDTRAWLIRVANPIADQLTASRKELRLVMQEGRADVDAGLDPEVGTLSRHLNVIAGASSARWIGALSIKPYRDFLENFFQNDRDDLIDGDGQHFLQRHRALFDSASITHLTQFVPKDTEDRLPSLGFIPVAEQVISHGSFRLYRNPQAYPKAYLVPNAQPAAAADDIRYALADPNYHPRQLVYISGEQLPSDLPSFRTQPISAQVELTRYEDTMVDVAVTAPREAWLVVTDSTTPQWHTFIDNQPVPYYVANSIFKAARVPAGQHIVSFRYDSPAIRQAQWLTGFSLPLTILLLIVPTVWPRIRARSRHRPQKAAG